MHQTNQYHRINTYQQRKVFVPKKLNCELRACHKNEKWTGYSSDCAKSLWLFDLVFTPCIYCNHDKLSAQQYKWSTQCRNIIDGTSSMVKNKITANTMITIFSDMNDDIMKIRSIVQNLFFKFFGLLYHTIIPYAVIHQSDLSWASRMLTFELYLWLLFFAS